MEKNVVSSVSNASDENDQPTSWRKPASFKSLEQVDEELRPSVSHLELMRIIERMHRRYLDQLRLDLNKLGADDISPSQVMLLFTTGNQDLSVRDLLDRGHYLGSNASYNLKQLVQAGYIDRTASQRDRRSARIRLTEKGRKLCLAVQVADGAYQRLIVKNEDDLRALQETVNTLRRLEVAWTTNLHRGGTSEIDEV